MALLVVGKLCFAVVAVAVGWKLASELRREGGGLGLHALALAAIAIGGVGLIAIPIGQAMASSPLAFAGELGMQAGMVLLSVFVWRTFRAQGSLGAVAALTCIATLVGTFAWDVAAQASLIDYDAVLPSSHAYQVGVALPFLWSCVESAVLWSRGRRRLALGLADPEVVSRYLLWAFVTACFVSICILAILAALAHAAGEASLSGAAQGLRGLLYLAISVGIWRGVVARRKSGSEHEPAGAAA